MFFVRAYRIHKKKKRQQGKERPGVPEWGHLRMFTLLLGGFLVVVIIPVVISVVSSVVSGIAAAVDDEED